VPVAGRVRVGGGLRGQACLVGRLIPQFQIFFAAAPLQVLFGLSIFMTSFGMVIMVWLERYQSYLAQFT